MKNWIIASRAHARFKVDNALIERSAPIWWERLDETDELGELGAVVVGRHVGRVSSGL